MSKIGYVVKRYPRYSETFIVNEILSHESAGLDIEIFALRPPCDTHFQSILADVRAPVHYLETTSRATAFWGRLVQAAERFPRIWASLEGASRLPARDIFQAIHLSELAADHGVAHLHAHFASAATDVARLASSMSNIAYSFTAHAKDIFHKDVDEISLADKLREAAFTVTVSDFNVRFLKDKFDEDAARVRRIYNGLNVEEFRFSSPAERAPLILAVGRLVEKKGFEVLIDACAILHHKGCRFSCVVIGEGEERAALEERIAELELGDKVRLVGPRPRPDVIAMIRKASVMAVPCVIGTDGNQDGLPTVLLEAMALGTPCVSTDVTGIPEIVHHGETGLMVPQRDPRSLAAAMTTLLQESPLRCQLAGNARKLVEQNFNVENSCAELRGLFTHVMHEHRGATARRVFLGRVA